MQVEVPTMSYNSSLTRELSYGALSSEEPVKASIATVTPPRRRESRRVKRPRSISYISGYEGAAYMQEEGISPSQPSPIVWAQPLAVYIQKWLKEFSRHHAVCLAIPTKAVIHLTIEILR